MNNHGWGLKDMIIYTCIILFFLFLATYLINSLYRSTSYSNSDGASSYSTISYYTNKENIIKNAAIIYQKNNNINSNTVVDINKLINEGYMDPIYSNKDNALCKGYAKISFVEESLHT